MSGKSKQHLQWYLKPKIYFLYNTVYRYYYKKRLLPNK